VYLWDEKSVMFVAHHCKFFNAINGITVNASGDPEWMPRSAILM
jgi:hypothetical protein